jgi:hypothetical protein
MIDKMKTQELTHAEKMRRCDLADRDARIEMKTKYSQKEMTKIAVSEYRRGKTQTISKLKPITKWLKEIVWCNAHDTAWIEETINKLKDLEKKA